MSGKHDDGHKPLQPVPLDDYEIMEIALRELLIEKGLITEALRRKYLDQIESSTARLGARLVARAWVDPVFRDELLTDAKAAASRFLGIEILHGPELVAVENTARVHHVIVCTLCSCYPKALLGIPPDWYKSFAYRSRMVVEPRAVLAQFGTSLPDEMEIRVVDSTADLRYLVIPRRPAAAADWDEDRLASIVTRDSMIGVSDIALE
jgi:nitrile hydratase